MIWMAIITTFVFVAGLGLLAWLYIKTTEEMKAYYKELRETYPYRSEEE
jgi:hypothetical protein